MAGHRIAYRRVSSVDQSTARQLDGMEFDREFEDHISGSTRARPGLDAALAYLREGDVLVVHSLDRLARSTVDLLTIVEGIRAKGASITFVKDNLTFGPGVEDPRARFHLEMLAAVATFERSLIRERQREGIRLAQAKGKYKGRGRALSPERAAELRHRAAQPGVSKAKLAKEFGVSRTTLYATIRG